MGLERDQLRRVVLDGSFRNEEVGCAHGAVRAGDILAFTMQVSSGERVRILCKSSAKFPLR